MVPSGLVITWLAPVADRATNKPFPKVTEYQLVSAVEARTVQVMPSGLDMTLFPVPEAAVATYVPLP